MCSSDPGQPVPSELEQYPDPKDLEREEVAAWLASDEPERNDTLFRWADAVRRHHVGDGVHLRALLEISNHCQRGCQYCGLRRANGQLTRFRLTREQVLEIAGDAVGLGYKTLVMQSGEDPELEAHWVADLVRSIKERWDVAVTLSFGERPVSDWELWREAGVDRYLLKHETSDRQLYQNLHPDMSFDLRIGALKTLKSLGYQVGSGALLGLPGQTWSILAQDLLLMRDLDLDMVGCGPLIIHPETPLGRLSPSDSCWIVPATVETTLKVMAMVRILMPDSLIPVTTALATLDTATGRERGLAVGANVLMPDVTPPQFKALYEIYPGKACVGEGAAFCKTCLAGRIRSTGRFIATSQGHRGE